MIFHGNGGCYACHTRMHKAISAIGAPDLTDGICLYGDEPAAMFESIAYGVKVFAAWTGKLSLPAIREISISSIRFLKCRAKK